MIIDLTPVRDKTGPARLLDMISGRSKQVFKGWLEQQTAEFREGIEVVAMDGFTGFKTATSEELPDATTVMDPFYVVALAGDALDRCRQRVQHDAMSRFTLRITSSAATKPHNPVSGKRAKAQ